MKRIDSSLCVSHVSRLVVIALAALALCSGFAITTSAQTILPSPEVEATERKPFIDPLTGTHPLLIEGSFVNLNFALTAEMRAFKLSFRSADVGNDSESKRENNKISLDVPEALNQPLPDNSFERVAVPPERPLKFQWGGALKQSLLFLGIMHAYRFGTEGGTRAELVGPFWKDYLKALRGLRGWKDGDPFIVNYIGHPMQGSVSGFIQIHNDPRGRHEELSLSKSYWISRLKAFGWSAIVSTQFELGPFSEASLGNIGIRPTRYAKHPMAYVDLVITPVAGTGWLIGEDAIDRYLISRFESRLPNRNAVIIVRSFGNPTRSFANALRGKWPWYRDNRF